MSRGHPDARGLEMSQGHHYNQRNMNTHSSHSSHSSPYQSNSRGASNVVHPNVNSHASVSSHSHTNHGEHGRSPHLSSQHPPHATHHTHSETTQLKNHRNKGSRDEFSPGPRGRGGGSSGDPAHLSQSSLSALLMRWGIEIPENLQMMVLVWISRALPLIAGIGCVVFIIALLATPENWETDRDAEDDVILDRESNRGVFVSVVIAILLNIIGALMFYLKVRESLVVTNYGFILGPVIGYLLDQGVATDDGFRVFGSSEGFDYTFSSLIDGNFMRYIVTVFLDLFISNPLQDVMKNQVKKIGVINYLKDVENKGEYMVMYDNFVAINFPSILQSIVSFITFNAYTNQTRFAWAYAHESLDRDLRIPPGSIMLSTAIASVLYLNFYTIMDYISEREYFDVNTKLVYVMAILGLLYALNLTDTIEAPVEDEEDEYYTEFLGDAKAWMGLLLFLCFVMYGFAYPLYTRIGCCGRCKPDVEDDHFGDEAEAQSVAEVRGKVSDEVLDKVGEILKIAQGIDITEARAIYEKQQMERKNTRRKR